MFKSLGIGVKGNLKTNLRRISEKIEEYEKEEQENGRRAVGKGVFTITDMIRATLKVK